MESWVATSRPIAGSSSDLSSINFYFMTMLAVSLHTEGEVYKEIKSLKSVYVLFYMSVSLLKFLGQWSNQVQTQMMILTAWVRDFLQRLRRLHWVMVLICRDYFYTCSVKYRTIQCFYITYDRFIFLTFQDPQISLGCYRRCVFIIGNYILHCWYILSSMC